MTFLSSIPGVLGAVLAFCISASAAEPQVPFWQDASLPDTTRLRALSVHIWSEHLFVRPDSALQMLDEQLALARRANAPRWEAEALKDQGIAWKLLGEELHALDAWAKAMDAYGRAGEEAGLVRVQINTAILHMERGRFLEALDLLMDARRRSDRIGNERLSATVHANLGAIHKDLRDAEQARRYLEQGLDAFRAMGDSASQIPLLGNLSDVFEQLGDTARALATLQECLRMAEAVGHAQWVALASSNLGLIVQVGDPRSALAYHERALEFFEETGDPVGRASVRTHMARAWLALGDARRAEQLVREAYDLAFEAGANRQAYDAAEVLYGILRNKGDQAGALRMLERYVALRDSVVGEDQRRELLRQQFTYDFEKKEALLVAEQGKKEALAKAELQRRAQQRNGLLVGLALLAVVALVIAVQRNRIRRERDRSDELLLNILPQEVAGELKEKGEAQARHFDTATILFTDFKGFTQLSEQVTPAELVAELNTCFKAFDAIMGKYRIEKIKTIGDAYMAAGGLPDPAHGSPADVVRAALEMQDFMKRHKAEREAIGKPYFEMRAGIHTGPVVAGIVGVKKFQYDIWGDTVNTAARMESSGEVGKVNISEATYALVRGPGVSSRLSGHSQSTDNQQLTTTLAFVFTPRGKIQAKGKGEIEMYFVERATGLA